MKTLIAIAAVVLLAGCGHMRMDARTGMMSMQSGSGTGASSSVYGSGHFERDDAFHTWVN